MHPKSLLLTICLLLFNFVFGQTTTIKGLAPTYVGKTIELHTINDYFSNKTTKIASTQVKEDSTFVLYSEILETQKIIIKAGNNSSHLYVQPNGKYDIFLPEKDKFDPYKPTGNQVEISFFSLDSTDINFKILGYQRWQDNFLGNNYYLKSTKPLEFVESLDRFKTNVEKAYKNDTSSFFKTYVRFSIAGLDNIQHAAARNRYEKHDFYIKHSPVEYKNDAYMLYIKDFYQNLMPRLSNEANEAVYEGILRSSPTVIMNALGSEYTLLNLRIREMIMINALGEVYNSGDYPETNIKTILDSVQNHAMFSANKEIAGGILARVTELVPGGKAPDFVLNGIDLPTKTIADYKDKHLYLHFIDINSQGCMKELDLLIDAHKRYGRYVKFVTLYKDDPNINLENLKRIQSLTWDKYSLSNSNSIWNNYQIESFPHYTLIDATGYIVSNPALGPTPNGQYETIDKTFFHIQKAWHEANPNEKEYYERN